MFDIRYNGLRLVPSKSAMREMIKLGLDLIDCKEILENGNPAPRKRSIGTEEKWLSKGVKTYNVVVVRSFNCFHNEEVQLITHIGKFGRKTT